MAKAKTPKLSLPLFLNAIQVCRPKDPSLMIRGPLPAAAADYFPLCSSTLSFHLSLPNFPDPPSTPDSHSIKYNALSSRSRGGPSKPYIMHGTKSELDVLSSHEYYCNTRKSEKGIVCVSSFARKPPTIEKEKEKPTTNKPNANHENHVCNPCQCSNNPSRSITEEEPLRRMTKPRRRFSTQRLEEEAKTTMNRSQSREQNSVSRKAIPRRLDKRGKHEEGSVVVKRSDDPYEDFKKSMLEMIVEKQMFEPKELEQLLMSFLSLNSKVHHRVILQAFAEILKEVFSGSSG